MALIRPRLTDYHDIALTQTDAAFAIPLLNEDIPLYVDPFLLWKSPSLQDNALHTALISSFNHFGYLSTHGREQEAVAALVELSECPEVGLGSARNRRGHRIGAQVAQAILSLFQRIPHIQRGELQHIEELQLYVDQVARDRISDFTCSIIKSFLIDFTIDQCETLHVPLGEVVLPAVFDYKAKSFRSERLRLPVHPDSGQPLLLVPKRWLRYVPWISYDEYFAEHVSKLDAIGNNVPTERIAVLNYNRQNYDMVQAYVYRKELARDDCKNDPLFKAIPVQSAKRKLAEIRKLPTGTSDRADKRYEDAVCQLMASLMYPQLDFADCQSRTDSGSQIRDLLFYNSRSMDFLQDIYRDYRSRQIVMELKNVAAINREHIAQLNRYLAEHLGHFGVIITRAPLSRAMFRSTIDLWSGQRKCIIVLTDRDLEYMVTLFESRQRLPIEVLKRVYLEFVRSCPS